METLLDLSGTTGMLYSHVIDAFITTFVALFSDTTALGSMDMYIPCYMLANNCAYLKGWHYFDNLKMASTISWVVVTWEVATYPRRYRQISYLNIKAS